MGKIGKLDKTSKANWTANEHKKNTNENEFFDQHEGHRGHEERIKYIVYPAKKL